MRTVPSRAGPGDSQAGPRDSRAGPGGGFTLVELTITVAVIAILASVAVPNYLRSRITTNESAVLALMRTVANAQLQFQTRGLVDVDRDSAAEYGTLREMIGAAPLRSSAEFLSPPVLPQFVGGTVDATGRARRHGYYVAMYLPDGTGTGAPDTDAGLGDVDPDRSTAFWTCLAWPVQIGQSGERTFFVNQKGEVLMCRSGRYSGTIRVPPAGAALRGTASPDRIDSNELAANQVGADGFRWVVVR